ncbi:phosphoribosylaminoimidazolesuccinocarboxamide synthase [Leucothrix arctica]|uniref:Phosphoribosylaminoimidazole-succinocarboxamide synthase n=2 Tax=Leucothrix arctica TaxID=1481894 RepID=A0A317C8F8_9GAMM|nr:phosphoribosylaminoimidazolesuccinocarboxamide synthase [Leucothrix arctica]
MSQPMKQLKNYELIAQGKVRDIYAIDEQHMLIVTTDRLSAFDVIMDQPIPDKGKVLLQVSNFWFDKLSHVIENHLTDIDIDELSVTDEEAEYLEGRAIVVRRLRPLPVEAVVRGYLIGSGWKDYQETGEVCGVKLPAGLNQASKLPETIFTPASKADVGDHDENISYDVMEQKIGPALAKQVRDTSLQLYTEAAEYALARGIIIADTKFEFGLDENDKLILIDEILTPDSSRFWPADEYAEGTSPPSFDKQFLRDYLETLNWNKKAPGPDLPAEVLEKTAEKYKEVASRLTESTA